MRRGTAGSCTSGNGADASDHIARPFARYFIAPTLQIMKIFRVASLVAAVVLPVTGVASAQTTVLRAARMITIESPSIVANAVVVVTGDKIVAAGRAASVTIPSGAKVIDLGDVTLLPGFVDAHTIHLRIFTPLST